MYDLPNTKISKIFWLVLLVIFLSSIFGFLAGLLASDLLKSDFNKLVEVRSQQAQYFPQVAGEQAIINVVSDISPAVVSIVVTKDLPVFERYFLDPFEGLDPFFDFRIPQYRQEGTERREVGSGSGFIVSEDGLILTNKHVVIDKDAEYTVIDNEGNRFSAQVLARDPLQDLAIMQIEETTGPFPVVNLGNSDKLQIGQTAVAIGNVLGEFRNSVSVGVVSGLGRTITATGGGMMQVLEDVIQTDAAINPGNSGGPLLNLKGEVIGINTAMAIGGENVGFAIPVNQAKRAIEQVKTLGRIVYPFLGITYIVIDEQIQKENDLPVDYGAWIIGGRRSPAISPGSAAEKAGLQEGDIVLEFNHEKISIENHLRRIIVKYEPGDEVVLRVLRDKEEKTVNVVLGEQEE